MNGRLKKRVQEQFEEREVTENPVEKVIYITKSAIV